MRDRWLILSGLVVFLLLITFPFWYNVAAGASARGPEPKLPAAEKQCVAPTAYMKSSHMQLLLDWREQVVRNGRRQYRAFNGRTYDISLTNTCLSNCHTDKREFCDRCHNYAAVEGPYCMDCHVDRTATTLRSAR